MLNKEKPIRNIFKLVDACTQCRQILHVIAGSLTEPIYKDFLEKVQQKLDQFGRELRNEIRRLGEADFGAYRFEPIPESGLLALRYALDYYEEALNIPVPPHTRAMIKRQYRELLDTYAQFSGLERTA